MKNYRESDYALNKFSKGIVYKFADETVELTMEDFLRETPGATEEDFFVGKSSRTAIILCRCAKIMRKRKRIYPWVN